MVSETGAKYYKVPSSNISYNKYKEQNRIHCRIEIFLQTDDKVKKKILNLNIITQKFEVSSIILTFVFSECKSIKKQQNKLNTFLAAFKKNEFSHKFLLK